MLKSEVFEEFGGGSDCHFLSVSGSVLLCFNEKMGGGFFK